VAGILTNIKIAVLFSDSCQ